MKTQAEMNQNGHDELWEDSEVARAGAGSLTCAEATTQQAPLPLSGPGSRTTASPSDGSQVAEGQMRMEEAQITNPGTET